MSDDRPQLDRIEDMVTGIHVTLHGAPGAEDKSHVVRLAKVEQRQGWLWGALVGSLTAICATFWTWLTGNK